MKHRRKIGRFVAFRIMGGSGAAAILSALLVVSCGGSEAPKAPAPKAERAPVPAPEPKPAPEAAAPAPVVETAPADTEYRYDARGRRDPFRSVLDLAKSKERLADLPPLQRVEIIDMKVTAIIWGNMGNSAMIKTPDGKGYTVQRGTIIGPNKGVIVKISQSAVTIQEETVDIFGVRKKRLIDLELHPQEERKE